ncbi:MAG: hypothetical protein GY913_31160 [Proteobacteria bacterium]|nr:hypothetical protein [Pseudomonadota bacterium]MCP4921378.1 hypothetical protein [Pseudomonadota bacterium]
MKHAQNLLQLLPIAATLVLLGFLVQGFLARAVYPFDIEWMEGGMLVHVLRVREGLGLYIEPDADFIPYIYPPLYPWVCGLFGEPSYLIGRSVSMAGTLAAAGAAVFAVRKEGAAWGIAVAAGGLYLSCYGASGFFYDLVRADSLAIGFAAWSIALCRQATPRTVIASGLLLTLAFVAKHNWAMFGLPMLLWLGFARSWRVAGIFAAASVIPALVVTAGIQVASDGHYLTYLLEVPSSHPLVAERAWPKSEIELLECLKWTSGLAAIAGLVFVKRFTRDAAYWLAILGMAAFACILMRAHHGGYINVLMPGHWAIAVCGGAMLGRVTERWQHPGVMLPVAAVLCWQIWDNRWDPAKTMPTAEDAEAGQVVIDRIAEIEGPVFAPHFPWYPVLAGKEPSVPLISLWDIDHKGGPYKPQARSVRKALAEQRWAAVITPDKKLRHGLEEYYESSERFSGRAMLTRTGYRVKPTTIWVPKDLDPEPDEAPAPADPELPGDTPESPGPVEGDI